MWKKLTVFPSRPSGGKMLSFPTPTPDTRQLKASQWDLPYQTWHRKGFKYFCDIALSYLPHGHEKGFPEASCCSFILNSPDEHTWKPTQAQHIGVRSEDPLDLPLEADGPSRDQALSAEFACPSACK